MFENSDKSLGKSEQRSCEYSAVVEYFLIRFVAYHDDDHHVQETIWVIFMSEHHSSE